MTRRAVQTTRRHLFLLLVGLGLLTRVLIPVGWMPHVSNGDVRLVLCGGFGPLAAQAPIAGDHEPQATDDHARHGASTPISDEGESQMGAPCPFTLAAASALLIGDVTAIGTLLPVAIVTRWSPVDVTRARRLAAPPPPAIGPPAA